MKWGQRSFCIHVIYHFSNWYVIISSVLTVPKLIPTSATAHMRRNPCRKGPPFASYPTFNPFLSYESSRLLAGGKESLNSHEQLNRALVASSHHHSPFSPQRQEEPKISSSLIPNHTPQSRSSLSARNPSTSRLCL